MRHLGPILLLAASLPATARAEPPRGATPPTAPLAEPRPRSTALAITLEVVSPVGGAGCFLRHRYVIGAIVTAASLISGGMMIHGLARRDPDETNVNAVAFGISRLIGVVAAARLEPIVPAAPRSVGLFYGLSF